jgi:hypothetical protein
MGRVAAADPLNVAASGAATGLGPSIAHRRAVQCAMLYAVLLALVFGLVHATGRLDIQSLLLGFAFPGGGFLAWTEPASAAPIGLLLCASSGALFLIALALWFATGNIVMPGLVWSGAALTASGVMFFWPETFAIGPLPLFIKSLPAVILAALASAITFLAFLGHRQRQWHSRFVAATLPASVTLPAEARTMRKELSFDDLRQMRLILDRALQPLDRFDGFEWIDQFQTAAVRYQINFMSYALSIAAHAHLPAFEGYLATAQRNLVAKQLDHRIWRYWAIENLWGNFSTNRDPIACDNIMFSGFLAAQIAFARSALRIADYDAPASLRLEHPGEASFQYSLPDIVKFLARRYKTAPYGLLASEPNWIYPLCHVITASALRAADAQYGTRHWEAVEASFRHHLETDFVSADGRLMAFRSSLIGFGSATIGGAILQSLPCLFLNSIFPDIAERQWRRLRHDLTGPHQWRFLWPIDVGNYGFSRASSYAATAAAAVELGDREIADRLLAQLDAECPAKLVDGVIHRAHASLWSHAAELIARLGQVNGLRTLVTAPHKQAPGTPYIKCAGYPDVLVAEARADRGTLRAVLYPGAVAGYQPLTIAGLAPSAIYLVDTMPEHPFSANAAGEADLSIPVSGRTALHITPAA